MSISRQRRAEETVTAFARVSYPRVDLFFSLNLQIIEGKSIRFDKFKLV